MPKAPETYTPPHKKITDVEYLEPKEESSGSNPYSHRRYRNWRARKKKAQRLKDEQRVHELYQQSKDYSFQEYIAFLKSDNPLCVDCLDEGHITPGRVLDHKTPIEKGGAKYEDRNLQWLCDQHHNIKRATEDKK